LLETFLALTRFVTLFSSFEDALFAAAYSLVRMQAFDD
jgi:hypothetical protein